MQVSTRPSPVRWLGNRWWPESGAVSTIPALDGLRAVAVVLVLLFHAWYGLPGYIKPGQDPYQFPINYGRTGVHLFFVLSGFLLFMPYARWILNIQARPSTRLFYRRRLLRVGPAYWVCLFIMVIAGPYTLAALFDVATHIVFLSNAFPQTTFTINGVFWTMAIEVQFYLMLPLFANALRWLSRRFGPRLGIAIGLGSLILVSLIETFLTKRGAIGHVPIVSSLLLSQYSSLPFWLDVFACGMTVSVAYVYLTQISSARRMPRGACVVALTLGVFIGVSLAFAPMAQRAPFKDFLFGIAYAGLLLGVLGGPTFVKALFASRPLRFVGLISYSFYLWHTSVLGLLDAIFRRQHTSLGEMILLNIALGLPVSILAAYLSYQCVERPFIHARKRAHDAMAGQPAPVIEPLVVRA